MKICMVLSVIVLAFVAEAHAVKLVAKYPNDAPDSIDNLVGKMNTLGTDLIHPALKAWAPLHADLDKTTVAKSRPDKSPSTHCNRPLCPCTSSTIPITHALFQIPHSAVCIPHSPFPFARSRPICNSNTRCLAADENLVEVAPEFNFSLGPTLALLNPKLELGQKLVEVTEGDKLVETLRKVELPSGKCVRLFEIDILISEASPSLVAANEILDDDLPDELSLHKSDRTGLKIWPCALPLLKFVLKHVAPQFERERPVRVLELGSGCGLLGLSIAASIPDAYVLLTDPQLPFVFSETAMPSDTLSFLRDNVGMNWEVNGNRAQAARLRWGDALDIDSIKSSQPWAPGFDLIVGSDLLYSPEASKVLLQTIQAFSTTSSDERRAPETRVVLAWEERGGAAISRGERVGEREGVPEQFLEEASKSYSVSRHTLEVERLGKPALVAVLSPRK